MSVQSWPVSENSENVGDGMMILEVKDDSCYTFKRIRWPVGSILEKYVEPRLLISTQSSISFP